jgi:hypothetical protein
MPEVIPHLCWKRLFHDITLYSATSQTLKCVYEKLSLNILPCHGQIAVSSNVLTKQEVILQHWNFTPLLFQDMMSTYAVFFFTPKRMPINMVLKHHKQCYWYDSKVAHITVPVCWICEHTTHEMFNKRCTTCDFRLPSWSTWEPHSSGLLHSDQW